VSQSSGSAGYEQRDAQLRPLLFFGVVLALLVVGALAVSALLDRNLTEEFTQGERDPLSALRTPPPGPSLQPVPAAELRALHAREEHLLHATEWVDPVNGVVRIPVDDAIELVLREGLPVREGGAR
jgi:hypothetical protein